MEKISRSTEAIAWMLAKRGRTQLDASAKFGISQGAVSSTKAREDHAILVCEKSPAMVEKVYRVLDENPEQTYRGVAYKLGIEETEARSIMLGLRVKRIRDEVRFRESDANMDVNEETATGLRYSYATGLTDGARNMRETCAKMAEVVGGEHGAAIAVAIRSVEV